MNYRQAIVSVLATLLPFLPYPTGLSAASNDGYRWFQVEISIFTNDYAEYRDAELWSPERLRLEYPERSRDFRQLAEFLQVPDLEQRLSDDLPGTRQVLTGEDEGESDAVIATGPFPEKSVTDLRLLDLDRQAFLLLPPALSDFQTTNSRLERSPSNRLLFNGVWRQPVVQQDESSSLLIRGGNRVGQHHELEGTVTVRFNANEDRVVIDANLWLTEFSRSVTDTQNWQLPAPPGRLTSAVQANNDTAGMAINRIVQLQESRDMRSNEFHYLDHPAMGLVISVFPYDLPNPVSLEFPVESQSADDDL